MDYQYHIVEDIPLSKIEVYHKVHALLANWYPGYPAIIQMADSNTGVVIISGINNLSFPTGYKKQTILKPYTHRMKIECRDNRLRIGIYYQTIVDEHALWINERETYPNLISEKKYIESLMRYENQCEQLQSWIDETILNFRNEIIRPTEDW